MVKKSERHDLKEAVTNWPPEEQPVTEYVNAAVSSANRSRTALVVLLAATILLAVQLRNTTYSWTDERITVREAAIDLLEEASNPDMHSSVHHDPDLFMRAEKFIKYRGIDLDNQHDKSGLEKEKTRLEKEIDDYRRLAIQETSFVHTPFFGASFERNDTGLFAGFAITVILMWLRYCMARELSNLNLLFNTPLLEGTDYERCYRLLGMQQVLTVPQLSQPHNKNRWRWIPKLLYLVPLPIYFLGVYFDLNSLPYVGEILGYGKAWFLEVTSILFSILILIFTLWCFKVSIDIDRVWDRAASRVYSAT